MNTTPYYVGLDWADDHHDLVMVDAQGSVVTATRFDHDLQGWQAAIALLVEHGRPPVAIELTHGIGIQKLLESDIQVYPVHPLSAKAYRHRKAPSGVKDDQLDAWSLADALRVDGHAWKTLTPCDPLIEELRILCRDQRGLIETRTQLVNELTAALKEYYPAALEAFDNRIQPAFWQFIETFPTPQSLAKAGKRRWEKFLHSHKLWRANTTEKRLEIFARADQFAAGEAVTKAKSRLATSTCKLLRTLQVQIEDYQREIQRLFDEHPDSGLFGSLPGLGPKLAPRLLSELGSDRTRFEDPTALQCYAGTAPVTKRSGQITTRLIRRAANKELRCAVHLWADLSRKKCAWAEAYYRTHREKGKSHACALRCLGQRWLKILWRMWQDRCLYNEALHLKNQVKHGSWNLQLNPQ